MIFDFDEEKPKRGKNPDTLPQIDVSSLSYQKSVDTSMAEDLQDVLDAGVGEIDYERFGVSDNPAVIDAPWKAEYPDEPDGDDLVGDEDDFYWEEVSDEEPEDASFPEEAENDDPFLGEIDQPIEGLNLPEPDSADTEKKHQNVGSSDSSETEKSAASFGVIVALRGKLRKVTDAIAAEWAGENDFGKDTVTLEQEKDEQKEKENQESGEKKQKKPSSKPKTPSFSLKKILRIITSPYTFAANLIMGTLGAVLGILGSIPIIGAPFKMAASFLPVLRKVLPAALIVGIAYGGYSFAVESAFNGISGVFEGADGVGASVTNESYDKSTGEITATVENTGEVLLEDMTVEFVVSGYIPSGKFYGFTELARCEAALPLVEIEDKTEVKANCGTVDGWFPIVRGSVHE